MNTTLEEVSLCKKVGQSKMKNSLYLNVGSCCTWKEFEAYLRVKELTEKNSYKEADLRKKIRDRRPTQIPLIICSNDREPRKYHIRI